MKQADTETAREQRCKNPARRPPWLLLSGLALLGAALNAFPVPLGFGLDLLPGNFAGFLALLLAGSWAAGGVAAVSALPTLLLWGHPWALVIIVAEVLFVGWLLRRRPMPLPLAVSCYWLLPGALLLLLLSQLLIGFDQLSFLLVLMKQAFNGILAAAVAGLLALLLAAHWTFASAPAGWVIGSVRAVLLNTLLVLVLLPLLIFVAVDAGRQRDAIEASIQEHMGHALDMIEADIGEIQLSKQHRLTWLAEYMQQLNHEDRYAAVMARTVDGTLLGAGTSVALGIVELDAQSRLESVRMFGSEAADAGVSRWLSEALPELLLVLPEDGDSELFRMGDALLVIRRVTLEASAPVLLFSMLPLSWLQERLSFMPIRRDLGIFLGRGTERFLAGSPLGCANGVPMDCKPVQELAAWPALSLQSPQQRPGPSAMHEWSGASVWSARMLPDSADVAVTVGYDPQRAIQEYRARLLSHLSLFAVIAMLSFLVAHRVSRVFSLPLESNARAVKRLPDTLQMPRVSSRLLEVDALNHALQGMAEDLQQERRRVLDHGRRMERLVQNAPVVIWGGTQTSPQSMQVSFFSNSLRQMTGHESVADYGAWMALIHPSDRAKAARLSEDLFEQGYSSCELRLRTADGRYIWIYAENAVIDEHEDGGREVVGLWLDISDLKLRQAQLTQSSKLATLGEMATGIAHELNQPLQVIQLAAENALDALGQDDTSVPDAAAVEFARVRLQRVLRQSERAARIVDHMRLFGRRGDEPDALVALDAVVRDALGLLGQQLKSHGIDVRLRVADSAPQVSGQRQLLEQVIVNLLLNARDAIGRRRKVLLADGQLDFMGVIDVCVQPVEQDSVRRVRLSIADNGGGIAEAHLEHVFEPFFTTKELGEGPGLGLSISYGIVRDMSGSIVCRNHDEGACFTIELPAASDEGAGTTTVMGAQ